ncbi:MAG: hypothetical protein RL227_2094 [Pseudomonadota bacterium]
MSLHRCRLRIIVAALVTLSMASSASAADAAHCIEIGDDVKQESRTLKNTCSSEVVVFWCHNGTDKRSRNSACDPSKRLYRMNTPLAPDAVKVNRYMLPAGAQLTYGACFGSWYSFAVLDHTGRYLCLPQRNGGSGAEKKVVHTHKGPDVDSTCAAVTATAKTYGRVSECRCESHGTVAVCRVESTGKGFDNSSLINDAKRKLRDLSQDPNLGDATCTQPPCAPPGRRPGSSGVRG